MPRTVLHVIGSLNRGGVETVALELCRAIGPSEVEQTFLCLSGDRGTLAASFEAAGAECIALNGGAFARGLQLARTLLLVRPDIVQSHVALASGFVLALARLAGVQERIARIHSQGDGRSNSLPRRLYRSFARALLRRHATRILSVSTAAERFAIGETEGRTKKRGVDVRVVPNGVDLERYTGAAVRVPETVPVVLHVGRADPAKNRAALGPIAVALRERGPCRMWLVGTHDTHDLTGAQSSFEILGPQDDVSQLYAQAAALVLPSIREGLPGVVLEALASGLPVVASDIAGLRELVEKLHGITLVRVDASADQWAQAIRGAIALSTTDRGRIREVIANSEFDLTASVREWRSIWGLT